MDYVESSISIERRGSHPLPQPALLPVATSSLAVPRVVIPVIGPSESALDFDVNYGFDYGRDSLDSASSLNIHSFATKLVQSLVNLSNAMHPQSSMASITSVGSFSSNVVDSIKDLIELLEEQGLELKEIRRRAKSAMNLSILSEATHRSVELLIGDLERIASDDFEAVERSDFEANVEVSSEALSKETVMNLQLLIQKLEEEAKVILEEEETDLRLNLRPNRLIILHVPHEFSIDVRPLSEGFFCAQRTNIENFVLEVGHHGSQHPKKSIRSEPSIAAPSLTTARLSDLGGGLRDLITGMNFGIKKPALPVYDSERNVQINAEIRGESSIPPRRKLEVVKPPDSADEVLERQLKNEYGINDTAPEPLFSSFDDLMKLPQINVGTVRQDYALKYLQERYGNFFQNPILGRAHQFKYIT